MSMPFKPEPWAINPAETHPEWSWFWQGHTGDNFPIILPFWLHTLVEREPYLQRLAPIVSGSGWSIRQARFGQYLHTTGNSRLRYTVGNRAEFSEAQAWSVVIGIRFTTMSGDERTVFGKSSNGGTAVNRQIYINTTNSVPPNPLIVRIGSTTILTGADALLEDIWYLVALTNDASASGNLKLYSRELLRKEWIDEGVSADFTTDRADINAELQLGAHFSDTNDDFVGDILFFYYMPGTAYTKEHIRQLAFDPFGPIRQAVQDIQGRPGVAPAGRIMSSLVGAGGLAGMGGIAGQGGGLAA